MSTKVSTNKTSLVFAIFLIWLLHNAIAIEGVLSIIIADKDHLIFKLETDGYLRFHNC